MTMIDISDLEHAICFHVENGDFHTAYAIYTALAEREKVLVCEKLPHKIGKILHRRLGTANAPLADHA